MGGVWSGMEKVYNETGVMIEYLTLQKASEPTESSTGLSICNSRDMTILGGYLHPESENPRKNFPHFLPYTITVPKNFTDPKKRVVASELLIAFNYDYVRFLEGRMGRDLIMQDFVDRGFAQPSSNIPSIQDQFSEQLGSALVRDHLAESATIFERYVDCKANDVRFHPENSLSQAS